MDNKIKPNKLTEFVPKVEGKKPDENIGYYFSSHLKIFDPETKKIFVQKRADT